MPGIKIDNLRDKVEKAAKVAQFAVILHDILVYVLQKIDTLSATRGPGRDSSVTNGKENAE